MSNHAGRLAQRRLAAAGRQTPARAEAAWELTPGPLAASEAREALRGWLAGLGAGPDADSVAGLVLAASEVAANAGVHGLPPVTLTAVADGTQVTVAVADASPVVPLQRQAAESDERGRGLAITGALTDWLETVPAGDGKEVRFGVTVPELAVSGGDAGTGDRSDDPFGITGLISGGTAGRVLAS